MISSGQARVHEDALSYLYDNGLGSGDRDGVGEVLYNVGLLNAALVVESIRAAQSKYGKKPLTGEEVRWGIENLNISEEAIEALGLTGYMYPVSLSCSDHEGKRAARLHRWNGESWDYSTDWISADDSVIQPMVKSASDTYAKEAGIPTNACDS
jgi:branched-chain amino acid transport system substrate-binding protein